LLQGKLSWNEKIPKQILPWNLEGPSLADKKQAGE
jgi:hypothetical protein